MDRRKTILFIGALYCISVVAAGIICYKQDIVKVDDSEIATQVSVDVSVSEKDDNIDKEVTTESTTLDTKVNGSDTQLSESGTILQRDNEQRQTASEAVTEQSETVTEPSEAVTEQNETVTEPSEAVTEQSKTVTESSERESGKQADIQAQSQENTQPAIADTIQKAESDSEHRKARVVNTGTDGLNVRDSAGSMDSGLVGLLDNGEEVQVIDRDGEWYHIKNDRIEGYCYFAYLEFIE